MIGVLVSGEGTNLQALIDASLPIVAVASNKAGARALERAEQAGIATAAFELDDHPDREARDAAMADWLASHSVDLVVCAGYMHLLRRCFLERFPGRVINTHSAPLPDFAGPHPICASIAFDDECFHATRRLEERLLFQHGGAR